MKIMLIAPYVNLNVDRNVYREDFYPSAALLHLAAVLRANDFEPIIVDLNNSVVHNQKGKYIDYCKKIREKIPNIGLWKAFRIKTEKDIDKIKPFEDFVDAILLDSWSKETYGGSGKKINSIYLKNLQFSKPWFLAGGISIEWIHKILTDFKPDGLDISSSIEISPGLKDIKKTEDLFKLLKRF